MEATNFTKMENMFEIIKVEDGLFDENTQILHVAEGEDIGGNTIVITSMDGSANVEDVLGPNDQIIQIITDYQCMACHQLFQTEEMLQEHLKICTEDDDEDDSNIFDYATIDRYDDSDEEEANDEDDPGYDPQNDSDPQTSKNNNESDKMEIKPVKSDQCHCCAEDAKTAHTSGNYECKTCEFFFRKMSSLKRHNIVMHWEKHPCTCEDCGIVFDDKKSYDKHRYTTHKANNVFKCDQCDTYFSRSYHLNRHKMQSGCHGELKNTFVCSVCEKVFTRKDNLREHLRIHAGAPLRQKKKCNFCSKEFFTNQQLVIHERMHTGERPFECDLCTKTFLSSIALKKHRRIHTGEKPFECKFCQKRFAARETLNRHERTHTGEKPHVCQYCAKSFIQAAQLKAHVFHHTGENGFTCEICNKTFNRKARLTVHKKFVHEGATPFQCETCDKSFTRKEDLMKHTILHTGVKPFKCDKCDKSFAARSSLHAHRNTHRREAPSSCTECGRAFIRHDCLMRHIRAKHRELLEDVLGEAEKKHLKMQLFTIASTAAAKTESGESRVLSQDELLKAIMELLTVLIEEESLQVFGWPKAPVQDVLEAVIRRCGHPPVTIDSDLMFAERLRENVKLLFNVVIEDENLKSLMTTQTVDEVILHVLEVSKS